MKKKALNSYLKRIIYSAILISSVNLITRAQTPDEPQPLSPNQTLEREITGAATHRYQFDLQANEFLQVRVEQKGVDVALKLVEAASGKVLATMDSPNGTAGFETLSYVTPQAGRFLLEVAALDANVEKGNYNLARATSREATAQDKRRVEIEKLFVEGVTARDAKQTEVALEKLKVALVGWQELKDDYLTELTEQQIKQLVEAKPQITDPLVKSFVERVNQIIPMLNEGQKFLNLVTTDGNVKAEARFLEALELSKTLYRESEDEKLLANISQTGYAKADWQFLIKNSEINSLSWLGNFYRVTGNSQQSLNYNISELKIIREVISNKDLISSKVFEQIGEYIRFAESNTASSIASILASDLDKPQDALDYIDQAIVVSRQIQQGNGQFVIKAKEQEAEILLVASNIYRKINNRQKSIESLIKSFQINESLPNREKEIAFLCFAIGNEYHSDFDFKNALDWLLKGLSIVEKLGNKESEVTILGILALIYEDINNTTKANEIWQRQLDVFLSSQYDSSVKKNRATIMDKSLENYANRFSEIQKSLGIANAYKKLKQYEKALEYYNKALSITRVSNQSSDTNTILALIGNLYLEKEDWVNGEVFCQQAVELSRNSSERSVFASNLSDLAYAKLNTKKLQEALRDAEQSLLIYQSLKPSENIQRGYASNLAILSRIHKELDNQKLAIFYGKQAINAIQRERQQLQNLDAESQRGYLKNNEKPYRRLADWLVAEGRLIEAEQVLRMLKQEEIDDYLRGKAAFAEKLSLRIDFTPSEKKAFDDYQKNAEPISALGAEFAKLEDLQRGGVKLSDEQEKRFAELKTKLTEANVAFQDFLNRLAEEFPKAKDPIEDSKSNKAIQGKLRGWGEGVVYIYTLVGEERFSSVLYTPNAAPESQQAYRSSELNAKIFAFREAVKNPNIDPRPLGKELYDILIKPFENELDAAKAKTILWSLDGNLRLLPLAALWDGKQYFGQKYQNVVVTPVSYFNLGDKAPTDLDVLGLGVSESKIVPETLTERGFTFGALPSVPFELGSIVRTKNSPNGVLSGASFLDGGFTKKSFAEQLLKGYKIIHIASHFSMNAGDASRSFLLLGDGTTLTVNDLNTDAEFASKFEGVELLTLSACETAVSETGSNGKEVEGFAYVAQQNGAKAILATLWSVADESTALLMSEFYRIKKENPLLSKAEAMQKAQLKLIQGEYKTLPEADANRSGIINLSGEKTNQPAFKKDENAPFAHPYYWSPFVLIGNWK